MTQKNLDELSVEELVAAFEVPHWAEKIAEGSYTEPMAALPTRDGRRTGNAVMVKFLKSTKHYDVYLVVTDAGNYLRPTEREMKELFHRPQWIMKELLPAHVEAVRKYDLIHGEDT